MFWCAFLRRTLADLEGWGGWLHWHALGGRGTVCGGLRPSHCPSFTMCSFIPWSQPVSLLGGAMRTKPCKINSGCQSERVGGRGPGGHLEGVSGSPGRVALVMAASGPVWCLRQRQALPEVFQLCLELLPFHCQLLSLGHQFLERKYQVKGPFKGILIYPHICLHSCLIYCCSRQYSLILPIPCVYIVPRMTTSARGSLHKCVLPPCCETAAQQSG